MLDLKLEPKLSLNLNRQNKKIGIYNKGKNNKFINNRISGFDIGIQDEGEETVTKDNKID